MAQAMNVISCLLFCVLLGVLAHMAKSRQRTLDAFARSLQLLCSGPPEMFTWGCCSSSMNRCLGYLGLLEAILGHLGAGGRENCDRGRTDWGVWNRWSLHLGSFWEHLGLIVSHVWAILSYLRQSWAMVGRILGHILGQLGLSWAT